MDASARITNIKRSFNKFVKEEIVEEYDIGVVYGYEEDEDRDVSNWSEYISIHWISELPTSKSWIDVQINLLVRKDQIKIELDLLEDKILSVLGSDTRIPFYDFNTDIDSPILIGGMTLKALVPTVEMPDDEKKTFYERIMEYRLYAGRKI